MASNHARGRKLLSWTVFLTGVCALTYAWNATGGISGVSDAFLVRPQVTYQWRYVSAASVESGTLIPQNAHVVFQLPSNFETITREVLFGQQGENVRYWGYCFPANYDPKTVDLRTGFPGLIFLSEKERAVRQAEALANKPELRVGDLPTEQQINAYNTPSYPAIRHQLEVFKPNTMCYIMTEKALAIGLDPDGDGLNDELEHEIGTNPLLRDTDGDGLNDGIEYRYGTNPLIRDTDGDGIIDGIEDANWNGHVDLGETDPREKDTDRDGLCDGVCLTQLESHFVYMGEDQNLNGIVDQGETDPRKQDTDGDGVMDELEFVQCLATGADHCP